MKERPGSALGLLVYLILIVAALVVLFKLLSLL